MRNVRHLLGDTEMILEPPESVQEEHYAVAINNSLLTIRPSRLSAEHGQAKLCVSCS